MLTAGVFVLLLLLPELLFFFADVCVDFEDVLAADFDEVLAADFDEAAVFDPADVFFFVAFDAKNYASPSNTVSRRPVGSAAESAETSPPDRVKIK